MAGAHRRPSTDLKASSTQVTGELVANSRAFTFFQALRLLDRLDGAPRDSLRIRPALDLGFPAADLDRIDVIESEHGPQYRMTATFFGLYGSSSPLPTFYTEDLIEEASQDESVSRDFLDIFHHRLYRLLYECWRKYQLFFQVAEKNDAATTERLFCLLGLGHRDYREQLPHARQLLRYVGLFTQFPRSATGLSTLLHDALPGVPIALTPCLKRMATIPRAQRLALGESCARIGMDTYLGEEMEDRMGKFRITVGPLDQAAFLRFTPGKEGYGMLTALTDQYLTDPLEYELEVILAAGQARTVSLGDPLRSTLGVTTWVFSGTHLEEVKTRFAVH
jgi:type VI secretion system protein ImpH